VDANTIGDEATTEDHKTFSRPWKIPSPIRRIMRPRSEIMELACMEGGDGDNKKYGTRRLLDVNDRVG
jgi:hypothetical protein